MAASTHDWTTVTLAGAIAWTTNTRCTLPSYLPSSDLLSASPPSSSSCSLGTIIYCESDIAVVVGFLSSRLAALRCRSPPYTPYDTSSLPTCLPACTPRALFAPRHRVATHLRPLTPAYRYKVARHPRPAASPPSTLCLCTTTARFPSTASTLVLVTTASSCATRSRPRCIRISAGSCTSGLVTR